MSKENNEQLNEDETKLRQDDVSNDLTRKILERNGVETVTQDDKVISEKKDDKSDSAKIIEPEQVIKQEQPVTLTEGDMKALEDAGIDEESLDGKTIEEIKIIAQNSVKEQEIKDDTSQDQITVSQEEALKAGGFAGNLVGKSRAELLEMINTQSVHIGTQNEKLANPKKPKEVTSLNQQNLDTEESKDKDTPTPVDLLHLSAEEQAVELQRIIKLQVDAGIQKGLTESPEMQTVRDQASRQNMTLFHTELGKKLPDNVSTAVEAEKVFNAWKVAVKEQYSNDDLIALAKTPNVLITLISDHYVINSKPVVSDSVSDLKVKKTGDKSYQRIRDMIKNAPSGKATFNFKRKASDDNESDLISNEGSDSQKMMGRILAKHIPK